MTSAASGNPPAADGSRYLALGDVVLQSGETLPDAKLTVQTWGELNAARDNCVLIATSFGAAHGDFAWMVGAESLFDPARFFVVVADLFGNGVSSSPSNCPVFAATRRFPAVTAYDNARLQKAALERAFGIRRIAVAAGWSMGGQAAFHLAALFPQDVTRLLPICASAKTAQHNLVFLAGARAALTADCAYDPDLGWFTRPPQRALPALARFYAGWALSQRFYRDELWRPLGYRSLDDFIVGYWEKGFAGKDPNNLLVHLKTWAAADISANAVYGGDLRRALGAIRARALVLSGESDLYFRVADAAREVALMPDARLCTIPSAWGHRAGNPTLSPADRAFLRAQVRPWLDDDAPGRRF